MSGADESLSDTGPMLPGFETCESATERWPTPRAQDAKHGAVTEWERENRPANYLLHAAVASPPLTSSAAASPASPSATPADAQENPILAGFGLSSTESFARLGPDGFWQRMYQGCAQLMMDGSLEGYSGTWPKRGTMRSGSTYPLPTLERPTSESESSSWPTKADGERGSLTYQGNHNPTLLGAVRWPTPREFMHKDTVTDRGKSNLGEVVGGQLNADWVSLLMGFPTDWCVVDGNAESRESPKDKRTE